jgi:hypothetical protein
MTKRIAERPTPRTFFEQVPVEVVRKVVVEKVSKKHNGSVSREPSSRKTEPYSVGAHRLSVV